MRDYRPQAELQDYSKVLKRGGMLGVVGTSAAVQAEEEGSHRRLPSSF